MISVIICSRNRRLANRLMVNIEMTIGVPYEVIVGDNSNRGLGICQVYNKAASEARFPFLCFVHEDVLFRTIDWGQNLIRHCSDPGTGLVGVAGGDSMSNIPSTWSNSFLRNSINIIQHTEDGDGQGKHVCMNGDSNSVGRPVTAVDGVFIGVRKSLFDQSGFDETLLRGFHGYDIDLSLQIGERYQNQVVYDILLEHFSTGTLGRAWLESTFLVADKWSHLLPRSVHRLSAAQLSRYHWQSLHVLIQHMFRTNYHSFVIYTECIKHSMSKHFTLRRFAAMNKLFLSLFFQRMFNRKDKKSASIFHLPKQPVAKARQKV